MKILIGMPSKDSWGGPNSSEPPFVEALRDLDVEITEEDYVYGDKEKPTPFLVRIIRVWKTALRFRKLLKDNTFDIVHLNSAFDARTILRDSFSLFLMNPKSAKVFIKFHGSEAQEFFETNFLSQYLINYLAAKCDGFGVHTTEEAGNFERLGFDRRKFFIIKNTIVDSDRVEPFPPSQKDPKEHFELLFVSRFVPRKCLVETVKACKLLEQKGYRFSLTCVGDGETRQLAETIVDECGLGDHVSFTGYVPESKVSEYFASSDILVFPTKFGEGFPNVFFKAVVKGLPIVSTRFRAVDDYLEDRVHCLICVPSPEDIAEKIADLIDNKALRESMSNNNLRFGKSLSSEAVAREYLTVYREITGVS